MDALSQIEQKYRFTFPGVYQSFIQRGYLTYPGEAYLWVHEAEWLPTQDMFLQGGFWGSPKPGLVAFAFTAGRDLWAWQTQKISAMGEPMIAYCPRDCFEGWWHAPNLLGWLYRVALEYASSMWDKESETKQNLRRWASVLREFNQQQWANVIESIAGRNVMVTRSGPREQDVLHSLVPGTEVDERIHAAFGPGFVDVPYVWDVDGEPSGD